jgi:hypothetical protein
MATKIKIALIPLDNRPVTYILPSQIAGLSSNIDFFIPPRTLLGGLTSSANIEQILLWLEKTLIDNAIDLLVCSMDTIAYGGLVSSRRTEDNTAVIKARLEKFKNIITKTTDIKVFALSTIMRISNNNINEEEKLYWDKYGELLFKYSYLKHKTFLENDSTDIQTLKDIIALIPEHILTDYLSTRQRNFSINELYISWLKENIFDYVVYSQDDTAKYGINVQEAGILRENIAVNNLKNKASVKTGADEIPLSLISKGDVEIINEDVSIYPVFSTKNGSKIISRYEDINIYESALGQIGLSGAKLAANEDIADIILAVHTPELEQGDHAMRLYPEKENIQAIERCINIIQNSSKPIMLADIAFANGADNLLAQEILKNSNILEKLYAYAGWNTTGNTLGSCISTGVIRYLAEKQGEFNKENFKKLMFVRLGDDWAYQTVARQKIRALTSKSDTVILDEELIPYLEKLALKLNIDISALKSSFPWDRTFEVEIGI